jgi:hypothetical protein
MKKLCLVPSVYLTFHIFDFLGNTCPANKLTTNVSLGFKNKCCYFSGRFVIQDDRHGVWLGDTSLLFSPAQLHVKSPEVSEIFHGGVLLEEFEDTKGVIRIRMWKNRQHNGQTKKYKRTNNDLQNIHIKLKIE